MHAPANITYAPWKRAWLGLKYVLAHRVARYPVLEARAAPFGLRFKGRTADVLTRHIYRYGCHEPALTRFVLNEVKLQPGDVALDIGANIGWYTLLLDRLAGSGVDIFAFEPDPTSYLLLSENLRLNLARHAVAVNAAVGDKPGILPLHRYKEANTGRHSLLPIHSGEVVEVSVTTLDRFWLEHGLADRPIRFLKIDVEGFEYFVLRGARSLLPRCRCVSVELSADAMRRVGLDPALFVDLILESGFTVRRWSDERLVRVEAAELRAADRQYDLILSREPASA